MYLGKSYNNKEGFQGKDRLPSEVTGVSGMNDDIRKNMALFPIGIVMKLTDLTARQIRYYEQHELVMPARTGGNQRLYSFNDVSRLLEIKDLIEKGVNIA